MAFNIHMSRQTIRKSRQAGPRGRRLAISKQIHIDGINILHITCWRYLDVAWDDVGSIPMDYVSPLLRLFPSPLSCPSGQHHLCGNSDLNLDASLNVDDDLLDDLGGGVQVDQALVDPA
jgi:hypothetical protein